MRRERHCFLSLYSSGEEPVTHHGPLRYSWILRATFLHLRGECNRDLFLTATSAGLERILRVSLQLHSPKSVQSP